MHFCQLLITLIALAVECEIGFAGGGQVQYVKITKKKSPSLFRQNYIDFPLNMLA